MSHKPMTYREAGVDIEKGNESVERIKPYVARTTRPEVIGGLGGFGGLFALPWDKYKNPVLVSGTDGVGTKLKLAFMSDKHDTIGIDAVAMCVNDILVSGAEPLFFLDYVAVGSLSPEQLADVVKGVAEGCVQGGCALIGGETAEMPGFYQPGEYDVAGFSVGIVERDAMIDGSAIEAGDVILGLPSTGLHSNGYSLARKIAFERAGLDIQDEVEALGGKIGEVLLRPTKIYVKDVLPLIQSMPEAVRGMVHVTGGGLLENVPRILPVGTRAIFDQTAWHVPPIFTWLQEQGQVPQEDMYRTFNMGLGFLLIIKKDRLADVSADLTQRGVAFAQVGEIVAGDGPVEIKAGLPC